MPGHGINDLDKNTCSVVVHTSITHVAQPDWDRMAGDVHMSHGWLRTIEETFLAPVAHRYLLVMDKGVLIGAAVCHIQYPTNDSFTLDDAIFGRFKDFAAILGLSVLPSLVCGPLRGYGQHFLLPRDLTGEDRQTVTAILFDALEREAASLKLSISFNNVMAEEHELMQVMEQKSFNRTINFPLNYLDIQWSSQDEYLKFLANRKLTREVNRNRKAGVVITQIETVGSCQHRLHQLLNENYMKYNGKPLPMREDFSSLCKKYLGSETIVYVAVKEGAIIGTSFLFHRQDIAYVVDVGVDHATAGNDFTYFNLTYYRPTADAVRKRIKRIYYGTMMYAMKSRRGCATTPLYLYHKPRRRLLRAAAGPLFSIHRSFKSWFVNRFY